MSGVSQVETLFRYHGLNRSLKTENIWTDYVKNYKITGVAEQISAEREAVICYILYLTTTLFQR